MRLIKIIAAALMSVAVSGAQAATLDQNFTTTDDPNHNTGLGIVTTGLGQSFTVGVTGVLETVTFNILKFAGTTADLTVDIRSLSGGAPDPLAGNALGSVTISNALIGTIGGQPYSWSTISADFSGQGINATAGDQLAFILSSTIGEDFAVQTDYLNGYLGGSRFSQNGDGTAFGPSAGADLAFSTSMSVSAVPLPAGIPLILTGLGAFAWVRRRTVR